MELEFIKKGSNYEAEFEATSNFNLHVERTKSGRISLFQKASGEVNYASQSTYNDNNAPRIINTDVSSLVYPKFVKIVSNIPVEKCVITMEDESSDSGDDGNIQQYPIFAKITLSNSMDENTFTSDSDNYNEALGIDSLNPTYNTYAYVTAEIFYKKGEDLIPYDNLLNYEITQSSVFGTQDNGIISVAKEGNRIITTYAAAGIIGGAPQYELKINGELIAQHYILKV